MYINARMTHTHTRTHTQNKYHIKIYLPIERFILVTFDPLEYNSALGYSRIVDTANYNISAISF